MSLLISEQQTKQKNMILRIIKESPVLSSMLTEEEINQIKQTPDLISLRNILIELELNDLFQISTYILNIFNLTMSDNAPPAASATAFKLSNTWVICAEISPSITVMVAGTSGICPDK